MAVDLADPQAEAPGGRALLRGGVHPDVERDEAERLAAIAEALVDPIRLQLVDVLRKHTGRADGNGAG